MRVLLLGATGLVGQELALALPAIGEVIAPSHAALDLADVDGVERAVVALAPDVVINATAMADVDRAEREPDLAFAVNARAVGALGAACRRLPAALVHVSTDYVFDGDKGAPYVETDPPRPLSAYGRSKLAGEEALAAPGTPAIVLRTAWVFGLRARCFVGRMLHRAMTSDRVEVADDQTSSPTSARALAALVARLVAGLGPRPADRAQEIAGVYHAAGRGAASRVELVRAALALDPARDRHRARDVVPVPGDHFPRGAPRPRHTPLDDGKLERTLGLSLPPWREALAATLVARRAEGA